MSLLLLLLHEAYDALDPDTKAKVDSLCAYHSLQYSQSLVGAWLFAFRLQGLLLTRVLTFPRPVLFVFFIRFGDVLYNGETAA